MKENVHGGLRPISYPTLEITEKKAQEKCKKQNHLEFTLLL